MAKQRNQVSNHELHPKFAKKNVEMSNSDDFWAICVRKRIFQEFSKFPLFGPPFPAVFPLFSRCSGPIPAVFPLFSAVRAQFPLFSRCFPDILIFAGFCSQNAQKNKIFRNLAQNSGFAAKTHKKTEFSEIWPRTVVLRPKRTKQQNFHKFCPEQVKTDKTT